MEDAMDFPADSSVLDFYMSTTTRIWADHDRVDVRGALYSALSLGLALGVEAPEWSDRVLGGTTDDVGGERKARKAMVVELTAQHPLS